MFGLNITGAFFTFQLTHLCVSWTEQKGIQSKENHVNSFFN